MFNKMKTNFDEEKTCTQHETIIIVLYYNNNNNNNKKHTNIHIN